jgi:hypothetical protein
MRFKILAVPTLLLLSLTVNAQFYQPKTYGQKGEGLSAIVKADLNHDGHPDVLGLTSPSQNVFNITAALGDGKGGFLPGKNTPVTNINILVQNGLIKAGLAVGDFNGDGFPDVVIGGSDPVTGAAAIGVMLGKGDGTFEPANVFTANDQGPSFSLIIAGDFTGHGKTDIAGIGNDVVVFPGNGDGTFGAPITSPFSGFQPQCIAAADFNNDGKLDLTVGTAVLLGNGNGTFRSPIAVPAGGCGVAVADLNHDGNLDLVTGSFNLLRDRRPVRVHLGNGTGKFDSGKPYVTESGVETGSAIHIADLNNDGAPDIAVLNASSDITVLLNNGDGTFKFGKTWNGVGGRNVNFVIGDFSGNAKKLDLVVGDSQPAVILGNGDGTFQDEMAQNGLQAGFIAADVNNDHKLDLVAVNGVELGNGDGTFGPLLPFPQGCRATTLGDFNHDGKLDIAGPRPDFDGVAVCLGNGNGTFGKPTVYDAGVSHFLVLAGAFTNDGKLDLAASDQGGISILLGNGDGSFQNGIPTGLNGFAPFDPFVLGDFNNDGKLDVAAITATGSTISVLLGQGNGKFSTPVVTQAPANQIYTADMNKDGKLDLVVLGKASVSVLLGNGDGSFKSGGVVSGLKPGGAVVGDFNLDGNPDVAVDGVANLILLDGDGKGGFEPRVEFSAGGGLFGIVAGDFNGDKKPDLAVTVTSVGLIKLVEFLNITK